MKKDRMNQPKEKLNFGFGLSEEEIVRSPFAGSIIFDMYDKATGERTYFEKKNVITYDGGIQAARLFKNNAEPKFGAYMLALGTGATGSNHLSPDSADPKQRKLNNEIERKAFAATSFRDANGVASSVPTNVVDFTTVFGEAEAVGPLNEMGLLSPLDANPSVKTPNPDVFPARDTTRDLTQYDVLLNYLTFGVITKPSTATLTITWRLTF